ncbi:MAG: PQQ-binding-like beta-propeller repeat protein [Candidatus Pacebacteria bacterium]|jgi:outer membrane protein assembly factor BamB|nr:PQQ-binding-like beta-propeller repeat protein [Candidatus Paceibacterota bacterium]MBT4004779.1 PQQ-binding-like beta-propeller repeat protein [Candidatus Paceibacterota bacterium]MBT7184130.1 PQQ-binding-like beta-propeller repeat protein [Candidatus Paceibacterota bacterium]MBT7310038.1 PQQ-binding-like beta-propeller repeat protein [Candidatus Paceibacterota bacterium]
MINKRLQITKALALISLTTLILILLFKKNKSHWLIYTPEPIGSYQERFSPNPWVFNKKYLFINNQNGNSYGINSQTGEIKWIFDTDDYSPFPVTKLDAETIAINSFDSNLYALDSSSGVEKWRFSNPNITHPDTPAITDDDDTSVFFGDRLGTIYAINKKSGEIDWDYQLEPIDLKIVDPENNPIHFGRIFQDGNNIYIRSSVEAKLISFDKKSGDLVWEKFIDYKSEDVLIYKNIVIANDSEFIYGINKKDGQTVWKEPFSKLPSLKSINNQSIYIINDKKITSIELETGKKAWILKIKGLIEEEIVFDNDQGYLFYNFEGSQSNLIVFNLKMGTIDWEKKLISSISTYRLLEDNILIIGSAAGQIFLLDSKQGEVIKANDIFTRGKITNIFQSNQDIILTSTSEGKHLVLTKLSSNLEKKWSIKSSYKINEESIYFHQNRIFFTDESSQLISSVNTTTKNNFNQDDFNFQMKINQNKEKRDEIDIHLDNILPSLFEKKDALIYLKSLSLDFSRKINSSIKRTINNYRQIKKRSFSVNQSYDQSILELTLNHQLKNKGPALDKEVNISAMITSPSGETYQLTGFIYQKNTWKIRFRPNEIGTWKYKIKIKTPLGISDFNFENTINIDQSSKIKYIDFKKDHVFNFYLEDGTQFHPLGLEDVMLDFNYDQNPLNQWGFANTPEPPKSNNVEFINFKEYLKIYAEAGFNFYRWGVGNASFTLWQELSNYKRIDFENGKYGDLLVKELRDQNYQVMMTLFGFHPPSSFSIDNPKNRKIVQNYINYVVSRYASYVDIWEITNEVEVSDEWLAFAINYIGEIDPYDHPITTNWDRPQMEQLSLLSYHWFESEDVLSTTTTTKNNVNYLKQFQKPILFSEIGNVNASWDIDSAQRMRVKLWTSFFNKAYLVIWNQPGEIYYNNHQNANIYLGPKERAYAKAFSEFTNSTGIDLETFSIENNNPQIEIFGLKNKDEAYIYIAKTPKFINTDNDTIKLPFKNKKIKWQDPATGLYLGEDTSSSDGEISLPSFDLDSVGRISL